MSSINDYITYLDNMVSYHQNEILATQDRKEKFFKIQAQYPGAIVINNAICVDGIWDKITCMNIEWSYDSISTKFSTGQRNLIEGYKLHPKPLKSKIASIKHYYTPNRNVRYEIHIFDYRSMIPDNCPRKKQFLKRIKMFLTNTISVRNFSISDTSFERDELMKLLLLK